MLLLHRGKTNFNVVTLFFILINAIVTARDAIVTARDAIVTARDCDLDYRWQQVTASGLVTTDDCKDCIENEVFHERSLQNLWPNLQKTADLIAFTEETFHGKLNLLSDERMAVVGWIFTL